MEMRLPVPPGARLPSGLLLLVLLLGAVCGVPAKPQNPGTLPRNISKAPVVSESGEQRGPDPGHSANSDWDFLMVWTPWSPCSRTCGKGTQSRSRSCGYACVTSETQSCRLRPCPGTKDKDPKDPKNPDGQAMDSRQLTPPGGLNIPPADKDRCENWLRCKGKFISRYVQRKSQELPSCPCQYPLKAADGVVSLFDERLRDMFSWKDASGPEEALDIYRPSAHSCLRSLLPEALSSLSAQLCCYDTRGRLLTRGWGAGTPELISPDYSPDLHFVLDLLPRQLCRGDWRHYRRVLPPNNDLSCPQRPSQKMYLAQLQEASQP